MKRATKRTLEKLDPWLGEVRSLAIDGLTEKTNGAFYKRRVGILHFHEDERGVYADVKVSGEWTRVQVDGSQGQKEIIRLLRAEYVSPDS